MIRYLVLLSLFTLALAEGDERPYYPPAPEGAKVPVSIWLTPEPRHARGLLVRYGPQYLPEANATYRGYDLSPYPDRCGVAVMSPADLGQIVWMRTDGEWVGPCLAIDVSTRTGFYLYVFEWREIVEVSNDQAARLGFDTGKMGEAFFGQCPPPEGDVAEWYAPTLGEFEFDYPPFEEHPIWSTYPPQVWPEPC